MGKTLVNAVGVQCCGPEQDPRSPQGVLLMVYSDSSVEVTCPLYTWHTNGCYSISGKVQCIFAKPIKLPPTTGR